MIVWWLTILWKVITVGNAIKGSFLCFRGLPIHEASRSVLAVSSIGHFLTLINVIYPIFMSLPTFYRRSERQLRALTNKEHQSNSFSER
jgi:hypothetical protein